MDYQYLLTQRRGNPAWRLLAADNAPMIASFLHASFIAPNVRSIGREQLASRLDDYLFQLHQAAGATLFPKPAASYLDDWSADERGWLRKYYPPGHSEAHYDVAASTERAISWLLELDEPAFVGTEARMATVTHLLHEIVDGSELDPRARIATLKRRKADIDSEIARVGAGKFALMDATQVRERFLLMARTARGLLADFRAVDHNLRRLDRQLREQIATLDGREGAQLQGIFGQRDLLAETDEATSFRSFWDALMSPARQDELDTLLDKVLKLAPVRALAPAPRLRRIHNDWLDAGELTQRHLTRLADQLRRHLDEQAWLENRRLMQLMRDIEQRALALRGQVDERAFIELDDAAPSFGLTMDRPLFTPPFKPSISAHPLDNDEAEVAADALFDQLHVDPLRLTSNIRRALQTRRQVSLADLVAAYPIEQGLAELAAYLKLATHDNHAAIDDTHTDTITWTDQRGRPRRATVPLIIYAL